MKTKPILYSTLMVQALIDGRKTQTRRLIKKKYSNTDIELRNDRYGTHLVEMQNDVPNPVKNPDGTSTHHIRAYALLEPKYNKGDILWVRETWMIEPNGAGYKYKASASNQYLEEWKGYWRPSIFMPKEAARIFLKVTNVRAQKLQDISQEDAEDEGVLKSDSGKKYFNYTPRYSEVTQFVYDCHTAKESFKTLWHSINGRESWEANPWVWVYDFEMVERPANFLEG